MTQNNKIVKLFLLIPTILLIIADVLIIRILVGMPFNEQANAILAAIGYIFYPVLGLIYLTISWAKYYLNSTSTKSFLSSIFWLVSSIAIILLVGSLITATTTFLGNTGVLSLLIFVGLYPYFLFHLAFLSNLKLFFTKSADIPLPQLNPRKTKLEIFFSFDRKFNNPIIQSLHTFLVKKVLSKFQSQSYLKTIQLILVVMYILSSTLYFLFLGYLKANSMKLVEASITINDQLRTLMTSFWFLYSVITALISILLLINSLIYRRKLTAFFWLPSIIVLISIGSNFTQFPIPIDFIFFCLYVWAEKLKKQYVN